MLPEVDSKHVEEARKLLIAQFRGKRVIQGLLDSYIRRFQDLENVLWDVINKRILADATNAQLLKLGTLVGEIPSGRTDDQFRVGISIRIVVNRSQGRIIDVIKVAKIANAPNTPRIEEHRYLNWHVETFEQSGERYLVDYLSKARAASSYGCLVASDLPQTELLCFDDETDPDSSLQTFNDAVAGGGKLAASCYGIPQDLRGVTLQGAFGTPPGGMGDGLLGDLVLGV